MTYFFLIMGTLTAFSGGSEKPDIYNLSMAILAVGCFVCAVLMERFKGE